MSARDASALIVAGGSHAHDFAATSAALAGVLRQHDLTVDIVDEPDDAWRAMIERERPYGLLAVNGLRFRMTHARYDSLRPRWGYRTPSSADTALDRHLGAGGAVLSTHTGCICFDDWGRWGELLGRAWSWDERHPSWHPERGALTIEPTAGHGAPFEIVDEIYTDMLETGGVEVLASCNGQPVVWRRSEGISRVGVTTVGHGVDTYDNPSYRTLLDHLVDWLTGT